MFIDQIMIMRFRRIAGRIRAFPNALDMRLLIGQDPALSVAVFDLALFLQPIVKFASKIFANLLLADLVNREISDGCDGRGQRVCVPPWRRDLPPGEPAPRAR